MKEGWKEVKLADYYTIASGLSKSADQFGSGFPFVSFKNVFWNFFLPDKLTELVNTTDKERLTCSVKVGDVFLTRTSEKIEELGMSSVALKDYPNATFNGFTKRLRPKNCNDIDPRFIGFYLRTPQFRAEITAYSSLTTRASLNNDIIGRLKILLPNLDTQRKIGKILATYDDLIENNLKRIKLLEEKAQLTYEEWFVKMRFPGYENAKFDEVTGLPSDWKYVKLIDCCDLMMGQSPKSEFYNDQKKGLPFHQGVKDYSFRFPINTSWSIEGKRVAEENSVLFSVRAPVGRLNVAIEPIILGRGLCSISHKKNRNSFIFYQLKNTFFQDNLMGGGAIFDSVTKKDIENIKMIKSSKMIEESFEIFASSIDKSIKNLTIQNRLLKEGRDILLPRLMSGLIDVEGLELRTFQSTE